MIASIRSGIIRGYLSMDIICVSKLSVFLDLRSHKNVRFSEQIMSADKYPSRMEAILYLLKSGSLKQFFEWISVTEHHHYSSIHT